MRLSRIKNLLPAPKDAEQLYLVVTPSRLSIDSSGNWKDSRDSFTVEVWKQKGDDDPTQDDMGEYAVHVFKNGSSTVSVLRRNTASFSVQAAITDKSFDVKLKVGDAFVQTVTVDVNEDGANGNPGGNTATVFLFKRSATAITAIDWSNTLTYTFATQQLASVPSGWTLNTVPSGTDPIYVTAATAYGTGATDTIAASEWATPVLFVENGVHGLNSASVFLYKRSASAPAKPTAALTYTFATGVLSGTLSGWSQNIPATDGNPCWVIQATAIGTGTTDTIAASEWSTQTNILEDGAEGNGISNTTWYYLATTMATGVTRATSGWISSYQQATPDLPYVWRYGDTVLTNGNHTYTDCELIFSYSAGANANLLEQTNFSSLQALDSWNTKGYVSPSDGVAKSSNLQITTGTQAHNAIRDFLSYGGDTVVCEELLQQAVTGAKRKLEPSTWYTLSFWSKGSQLKTLTISSGGYGYAVSGTRREIWLEQGHTYRFAVYGYINRNGNTSVSLRTFVWGPLSASNPWSNQANVDITSSSYTTATFDFTPATSGLHGLEAYIYPDGSRTGSEYGYVSYYTIWDMTCLFVTHVYPDVIDTSVYGYVDGERKNLAVDGYCKWMESSGWVRHTYTFKTKSSLDVTAQNHVLWRIPPCMYAGLTKDVYICMPKLEVGMQATGYLSNESILHSAQPRRRRWAVNTQYLAGGVDEPYLDAVLCQVGTAIAFYRCIQSHISTEDNRPGGTYGSSYWTSEDSQHFENLSTDLFFATKAYVNNLIATLIQTGYEGAPHIEAEGSEFKIFGRGQYPAIYLAVNDDNKAVLRFQNENTGEFLYDLGPDGIMKEFSEVADSYSEFKYHKLTNVTRVSELLNITASQCTSYYRFSEGYKQIGSGSSATKQYHISGTSTPSAKNSCFFTSKNYNGSYIPDGWYCKSNNGTYMAMLQDEPGQTSVCVVYIFQFSSGKLVTSVPVYFKYTDTQHASHSVGCDEDGNELSTSTYTYLYSYWQENNITLL